MSSNYQDIKIPWVMYCRRDGFEDWSEWVLWVAGVKNNDPIELMRQAASWNPPHASAVRDLKRFAQH